MLLSFLPASLSRVRPSSTCSLSSLDSRVLFAEPAPCVRRNAFHPGANEWRSLRLAIMAASAPILTCISSYQKSVQKKSGAPSGKGWRNSSSATPTLHPSTPRPSFEACTLSSSASKQAPFLGGGSTRSLMEEPLACLHRSCSFPRWHETREEKETAVVY